MSRLKPQEIRKFQKEILDWYKKNKRELPWRDVPVGTSLQDRAYRILVSEIMLQQTQVSRVIPKYEEWLKRFPTIESLARVSTRDVLQAWSGLGYNRRALYLKKIAETLISRHSEERSDSRIKNGSWTSQDDGSRQARTIQFPMSIDELKKLPGIGAYTARALACFAFDMQVAVVDTNVRKVILLKFSNRHSGKRSARWRRAHPESGRDSGQARMTAKEIQHIADQLLPVGNAYHWNHALMDFSAIVLSKVKLKSKRSRPKDDQPLAEKFIGSNRYYRGQIVKLLLERESIDREKLASFFGKDGPFIDVIVASLLRDGLVRISPVDQHRVGLVS